MDTSYLLIALRSIRDERIERTEYGLGDPGDAPRPWQYNEALDWIIGHIDKNYDNFEAILDIEREARDNRTSS